MSRPQPSKKEVMLALLEKSGVFIHLDPRREGVAVPIDFKQRPELVLQVGLNMPVPIPDLEVDEEGVFCTLSFHRRPHYCRMPWHAIFALVSDEDQRGVVWPEDAPLESQLARNRPAPRPRLRAVDSGSAEEDSPQPAPRDAAELEGEGSCNECGTAWPEDQDSCVLCGASRQESFQSETEERSERTSASERPPASTRPRLVPVPAAEEPKAPGDEASPPAAAEAQPGAGESPIAGGTTNDEGTDGDGNDTSAKGKAKRELPPYLRVVK